jgi:sterol desaturase/sphingolipid hydroxylase (fatty acid hydroxylase superfamily)
MIIDSFNYLVENFVTYFLIFLVLERLFAVRKLLVFRKEWLTDFFHYFIGSFFVAVLVTFVGYYVGLGLQYLVNADFQAVVRSQPGWLQYLQALLIVDFFAWLYHFLSHKIPFLWKFHAIHHSPEEMDWLIAARFHPVELTLSRLFRYAPLTVFGFTYEPIAIIGFLDFFLSMYVHSNIRFRFGILNWFIATPQFHHWHHANQKEAYDKNFAPTFPIWDIIFRTYYVPQGKFPEKYGVDEKIGSNYLLHLVYPFLPKGFVWKKRAIKLPKKSAIMLADSRKEASHELVTADNTRGQ